MKKLRKKDFSLPQLNTATFSHQLWIHETGLCTEVNQYHQAILQIQEQRYNPNPDQRG